MGDNPYEGMVLIIFVAEMGEVREGATLRQSYRAGRSTWVILQDARLGMVDVVEPAGLPDCSPLKIKDLSGKDTRNHFSHIVNCKNGNLSCISCINTVIVLASCL